MSRPEVIAHRGASCERPENSLAAFVRAAELGANAVELDVHLTADGHLVVHHDPTLPDGALRRAIGLLTLAEVRAFRVQGEGVPTLDEVISVLNDGPLGFTASSRAFGPPHSPLRPWSASGTGRPSTHSITAWSPRRG